MKIFIGMETSGALRRRFAARGHDTISCDILPAEDAGEPPLGVHIVGDVFATLSGLMASGWRPRLGIFHPTCTMHTVSAAWAFPDPDFKRYPGVGYHQRVEPGTLTGAARREARMQAEADVEWIAALDIEHKAMENPRGTIPARTSLGPPTQTIQPNQYGDDASKGTCLWLWRLPKLRPTAQVEPRTGGLPLFGGDGGLPRWANQTDSGQNKLTPGPDRWKDRSRTWPGPADAMVEQWLAFIEGEAS